MNKKISVIKPYFITMITTMIILFSTALIGEVSLLWRSEKKVAEIELSNKIFDKFHTIEELERQIAQDKDNYIAHIKLAQKYNEIKEYDTANIYFQTALKISERSNYSLYSYSMFCIERKLYNLALNLAEEITLDNKKTINYKAVIYEALGDALDKDGEIEASIRAYQVSMKYAKGVYNKSRLENLKTKYAKEYIKIADLKIERKEAKSAILDLENSVKIKSLSQAKYKLALIYKDINKQKAEKMIQAVLDESPYIVNPYIYNNLLNELLEEARLMGNTGKINYYTSRIKSFHKLLSNIYVFKDDLAISNIDIKPKKSKLFGKESVFLVFKIENNTDTDIEDLYLLAELYYGNNRIEVEKIVATKTNILKADNNGMNMEIKFPSIITKDSIVLAHDLIIKFYAKKQKKAPWTLIRIQQLK